MFLAGAGPARLFFSLASNFLPQHCKIPQDTTRKLVSIVTPDPLSPHISTLPVTPSHSASQDLLFIHPFIAMLLDASNVFMWHLWGWLKGGSQHLILGHIRQETSVYVISEVIYSLTQAPKAPWVLTSALHQIFPFSPYSVSKINTGILLL